MATKAHIDLGIDVVGTYPFQDTTTRYIVVTAVNKAGGESAKSAEATVTAELIDTQHITDLAVTTAIIDDLAVARGKIALLAVDTAQIEALAVTTAKIDNLAVDTAQIANLAVDTAQIANAAIETAKIDNLAVTGAKIDDATIGTAKIIDLTADKITAGTIGTEVIKLSNSSSSRIESNDGTSLIIRGNGSFVGTSVTITGAITATSGSLANMSVTGNLTLAGSGVFRTTDSGQRVEITAVDTDRIKFITADSFEASGGTIRSMVIGSGGTRQLSFSMFAPVTTGDSSGSLISIRSESQDDSTWPPSIIVQYDGGSSLIPEFIMTDGYRLMLVDGTAARPAAAFDSDDDTGMYRVTSNQIGFAVAGGIAMRIGDSTSNKDIVFGSGATGRAHIANTSGAASFPTYSFAGDQDTGMLRSLNNEIALIAGTREMFTGGSGPDPDEVRILPAYDNSVASGDDHVGITSSGLLRRQTSSLKSKKYVSTADVSELAAIDLVPALFKRRGTGTKRDAADESWHFGLIADWLIEQDERLGRRGEDGEPENFDDRAILAVLSAKIIGLEEELAALKEAA
jgi:hypothetical protein